MACRVELKRKSSNGVIAGGSSSSPRNNSNSALSSAASAAVLQRNSPRTDHLQNSPKHKNKSASTSTEFASVLEQFTMAGDIRLVDSVGTKNKQRKTWALRDRSVMSVHFLKANLAEEGCEEAQLDVAKKLLQDSHDPNLLEESQRENSRLAIYWLIKSSEQGNEEATKLLKDCLYSGRGITEQNVMDVRTCISTPNNEKLTYKAARLLYTKLNNGENFITTSQLLSRINPPTLNTNKPKPMESEEGESGDSSFSLNEDSTAEDNISEIPENIGLNETFTTHRSPNSSPKNGRIKYSSRGMNENEEVRSEQEGEKLTLEDLLKAAGTFSGGNNPSPVINKDNKEFKRHHWNLGSQINIFVAQLLFICTLTGSMSIANCLLTLSFLLSLWASFNILNWKRRFSNFKDWSLAFGSVQYESRTPLSWTDTEAENKLTNNLLLQYLVGNVIAISIFFYVDGHNILKIIASGLAIFSIWKSVVKMPFLNFRILLFLSILNFPLMILPVFAYYSKNYPLKSESIAKNANELVNICKTQLEKVFGENCCNDATLMVILQVTFLTMLLISTKRQVLLQRNLPEFLIALWITKVIQISSILEIIDFEISCVLSLLLISTVLIIQSNKWNFWKVVLSLTVILTTGAAIIIFAFQYGLLREFAPMMTKLSNIDFSNTRGFQQQNQQHFHADVTKLPLLGWDEYDANCHRQAWKIKSPAETQISCFLKYGSIHPVAVKWNGRITVVKIKDLKLSNDGKEINFVNFDIHVHILPTDAASLDTSKSWQSYLPGSDAEHSAPGIVLASTSNLSDKKFRKELMEKILKFRSGDKIEFFGQLNPTTIGGLRPEIVNVNRIKCLNCALFNDNYQEIFLSHSSDSGGFFSQKLWRKNDDTLRKQRDEQNNGLQFCDKLKYFLKIYLNKLKSLVFNNSKP